MQMELKMGKRAQMREPVEPTGAADIVNRKCDCCGRMIPSKPYSKEVRGKTMRFCGRDCYELYLDYKLKNIA